MAAKDDFTHEDWDIIGTALGYHVARLNDDVCKERKGAARKLARAERAARKVDAKFLETYPQTPATVVDSGDRTTT